MAGIDGRLIARRAAVATVGAAATLVLLGALSASIALNTDWTVPDPTALAGPTEILARDGTVVARFTAEVDRRPVGLDEVADVVEAAVVTAEDARFHDHRGVDPWSLVRAVVSNVRTGGISQGGSTLTQQYVKTAFVGDDRTLLRKVREAVIAIQLERDLGKDEILAAYLNAVYFGEGAHGIEAAARTFFDVPAAELDAAQAATLVQALPAPSVRNARVDPTGAQRRRDALLDRMVAAGALPSAAATEAKRQPVEVAPRRRVPTLAPSFVDHVRRQLEHHYGAQALLTGAMTVHTSLDLDAQEALDQAVAQQLPADRAGDVEAAAVALDPRTGEVLAIHGGRDHRLGDLNLATMTRRQNGSSFKTFVYSAAIADGVSGPEDRWPAPARTTIRACADHDGGPFEVRGGPGGTLPLREALARSANTTFQLVGCELGGPRVVAEAARLGVVSEIPPTPSVALGGSAYGASPLEMAAAYGTLANDGLRCPPRTILEIRGPDGRAWDVPAEVTTTLGQERRPLGPTPAELEGRDPALVARDDDGCHAVVDADVARTVHAALAQAVDHGTGTRARIGRPQAGKTGTTQDAKDAWFVGYTPHLSLAVWVGDPGDDGEVAPLRQVAGFAEVSGGTVPALIWRDAAADLLAGTDPEPFPVAGELGDGDGPRVAPARPVPPVDGAADEATDAEEPTPDDREDETPPAPDEEASEPAPEPPPSDPPTEEPPPEPAEGDGDGPRRCLIVFECR